MQENLLSAMDVLQSCATANMTIQELFEQQANKTPERIAVEFNEQKLTYHQLNERVNRLAHFLRNTHQIKPDIPVGIIAERSEKLIIAILAVIKAGGAYLPIDPGNPNERTKYIIEDSQLLVILTEGELYSQLHSEFPDLQIVDFGNEKFYSSNKSNPVIINEPDSLVYIIYTSGSTGKPKGVMIEHRNLLNYIYAFITETNYSYSEIHFQVTSFTFDAFMEEIFPPLTVGAKIIINTKKQVWDIEQLAKRINDSGATFISCTPALISALNDVLIPKNRLTFICGGEIIRPEHISNLKGKSTIYNVYGPTEATVSATFYKITEPPENPIPIGKPIHNYQVYIFNSNNKEAKPGEPGELCIGGSGLARGYLGNPELTSKKFTDHPNIPGLRIYRTGDLCCFLPDGNIDFLGRIDQQVKIRGFRIELGEIENTILQFNNVKDCVVNVIENENEKELAAYIIPKISHPETAVDFELNTDHLVEFLKTTLPEYMIPVYFVQMSQFPVTVNDKIDRNNLPIPEKKIARSYGEFIAPSSEMEKEVAKVWQSVLNINKISNNDNFFNLGGHSLMAFKVVYKLNQRLNIQFPLRDFFENPTIAGISEKIENYFRDGGKTGDYFTIRPIARNQLLPLSPAQQSLWFINEFTGDSPLYNIAQAIKFSGSLDIDKLSGALNAIFKRHESLRTTFQNLEGVPYQIVNDYTFQPLEIEDVSKLTLSQLDAVLKSEARKTFDLSKKFLLRWKLFKLSATKHILVINFNHIISDGWSMNVFFKELEHFYNRTETDQVLPPLPIQYPDYSFWVKNNYPAEKYDQQLAYWENKLGKNPASFEFPTDFLRPELQSYSGEVLEINLSHELTESLNRFSVLNGKTLFMTLLAAFKVLLYKYTDQEIITVGSPSANRNQAETENLIGYFVNSLVLKTDLSGDPDFTEVLSRIQKTALEAFENLDIPFDNLVAKLVSKRDLKRSPLFQIMFVLENATEGYLHLDDLKIKTWEISTGQAKFDLTIIIEDQNDEINIKAEYNSDLYDPKTIRILLDNYKKILGEIIGQSKVPISVLTIVKPGVHNIAQVSASKSESTNQSLINFFESQVEKTPDNIAVVFIDQQLTYRELNQKANQLARLIEKQFTESTSVIGILMDRYIDLPTAILAVLKTGKAYLPLDPLYPEERLKYMIEDTGTTLVLVSNNYFDFVNSLNIRSINLDELPIVTESEENLNHSISSEDLAYIMYTSGTTGKPNGVEIPHRGIIRLVIGTDYFPFGPSHNFLQLAPVSFDASTFEIWGALLHGSKLVIYPERVPSFLFLKNLIKENNISCLWLTASLFNLIIEEDPGIISGVPYVLTGGEALSVKYITMAQKFLPSTQFINGYGPTESTTFTCCYHIPPIQDKQLNSIPIGKPIANTEVYILNEKLEPVIKGSHGQLFIGGKGLAKGYHNRPNLTAEKFIKNPFDPYSQTLLYKTGDLCRENEDGNIEFIGRVDNQIKIRGFRIELGEIENNILQNESINECVVVAKKIPENTVLIAYIVIKKQGFDSDSKESIKAKLENFLTKKLPEYMIPEYFVEMDNFPLTANGKIDRAKLPEITYIPEKVEIESTETLSSAELTIRQIWEETLQRKNIRLNDNFFEIGGHSLLAAKIIYQVNKIFGSNLMVSALFQSPTIKELTQKAHAAETHELSGGIIQIKPGLGNPIFLYSGIDGNPFTFTKLANHFVSFQPLYFVQYPAGKNKDLPFTDLHDYVDDLITKIRRIQKKGPYYIAGYSLGGRIAFETAVQLQQAGEKIMFLGILSAIPPQFSKVTNPFVNFFMIEAELFLKMRVGLKLTYLKYRIGHLFERFFRKLSESKNAEGKFENVHLFVDVDEEIEKYLGLYNLWRNYSIKSKFDGDILLIRESSINEDKKYTPYYFDSVYPDYHWRKYVNGKIKIETVQFDHNFMLEEPYVQEIAEIVNNHLIEIEKNSSP